LGRPQLGQNRAVSSYEWWQPAQGIEAIWVMS
jgi:hypothetical protein